MPGSVAAINPFKFTHALVRRLSPQFAASAVRTSKAVEINQAVAEAQHDAYVKQLAQVVPNIIELPPLPGAPDCCFVEDTAVVIGNRVLACNIGHPSRRKEGTSVLTFLRQLGFRVSTLPHDISLDGGDVLYTGAELFIGMSSRTSRNSIQALSLAFPRTVVTPVPVRGALHLKSLVSVCGPNTLAISGCENGERVRASITKAAAGKYQFIVVPDKPASNCVYVNDVTFHRSSQEFPNSAGAFAALPNRRVEVLGSELGKADGALTCCAIFFNPPPSRAKTAAGATASTGSSSTDKPADATTTQ